MEEREGCGGSWVEGVGGTEGLGFPAGPAEQAISDKGSPWLVWGFFLSFISSQARPLLSRLDALGSGSEHGAYETN